MNDITDNKTDVDIARTIGRIETKLDLHLQQHEEQSPQIDELIGTLNRFKGAFILFRLVIYIASPIVVCVSWLKDHVKL